MREKFSRIIEQSIYGQICVIKIEDSNRDQYAMSCIYRDEDNNPCTALAMAPSREARDHVFDTITDDEVVHIISEAIKCAGESFDMPFETEPEQQTADVYELPTGKWKH